MPHKISLTRSLQLIVLLTVFLSLPSGSTVAQSASECARISLNVDPPTPLVMNESETLAIVVSAHYQYGPAAAVRLSAIGLPSLASGWSDNQRVCADCIVADTIYFHPGFCDSGVYNVTFVGSADYREGLHDSIVYCLRVLNSDRPCEIQVGGNYSVTAGEHLYFPVVVVDADSICTDESGPFWLHSGYPFEHGAILQPGNFTRLFSWLPSPSDTGVHTVAFGCRFGESECCDTVMITVQPASTGCVEGPPVIVAEPPYSPGTSNEICYRPSCGAYEHQVCYFDTEDPGTILGCRLPSPGLALAESDTICTIIESLEDGHTYGFFATAYFVESPDTLVMSEVTYTTQDATPPDSVIADSVRAYSRGVVAVYWSGVMDRVSQVNRYKVYRKPSGGDYSLVATISATPDNDSTTKYEYNEDLASGTGLVEGQPYHYMVCAVDTVGNCGDGIETEAVVPDATPPCRPVLEIPYDYRYLFTSWIKGTDAEVRGKSNCLGIATAHFIRFEAVRDSLKYFDSQWAPGYDFFETDWIACDQGCVTDTLKLLPPNQDSSYVNGHRYYVRALAMDSVGNVSEWSRIDSVYMDVFPPDDISNLTVTPYVDTSASVYVMSVDWESAIDHVSGLDKYYVYRKVGNGGFVRIDSVSGRSVTQPPYVDHCTNIVNRTAICYRVGSRDNVGNVRDWAKTNWEACARAPVGPVVSLDCDIEIDNQCYVAADSVTVLWTGYDNADVAYYEVTRNDSAFYQDDPSADRLNVPVQEDDLYTIRVRAAFINGLVSIWSNSVTAVKDGTPPEPVESLKVVNEETGSMFCLSWKEPFDSTGVEKYRIRRRSAGSDWALLDSTTDTFYVDSFVFDGSALTTYEYYKYKVEPVDLLGNGQDSGNAVDSAYCNRPPVIICHPSDSDKCITVTWERALPNLASNWSNVVRVCKDSDSTPIVTDTVYHNDSYPFCPEEFGPGYYTFQVKEIPLDLGDSRVSAWSRPCTVPFATVLPQVEDFDLQPQPLLPRDTLDPFEPKGVVVLHWTYENRPGLIGFEITRWLNGVEDTTFGVPADSLSRIYQVRDGGLYHYVDYKYCIRAYDEFGDTSTCTSDSINPIWVYTPKVREFDPIYFNDSFLTIEWEWVNKALNPVDGMFGAENCQVEVSTDSAFDPFVSDTTPWVPASQREVRVFIGDLIDASRKTIYCRIRATDSLGDTSHWSTEYPDLRRPHAVLDDVAPVPVSELSLFTRADSSSASGLVDIYLNWKPSFDREPGIGLQYYKVYRESEKGSWDSIGTSSSTSFVHADVDISNFVSCLYQYAVHPVDRLDNEQMYGNQTVCVDALLAPTCSAVSKDSIVWQYDGLADSFYVECSYDSQYLGSRWMQCHPDEAGEWVDFGFRGYRFATDTNFTKHDTIYFHIKAVQGPFESPWSEVATYSNGGNSFVADGEGVPDQFELLQNYPNPFNPTTRIAFSVLGDGRIMLRVFNIKGQLVKTLIDDVLISGSYSVEWDGTDEGNKQVASGVYFYRIKTADFVSAKKMVLLR